MLYTEATIVGEDLCLDRRKAIYWKRKNALLIADLHLGKAKHFRNEGLAVPLKVQQSNLDLLQELLVAYKPETVYFLGDLFHSIYNDVWEVFGEFIQGFPDVSFELILGNHDILEESNYHRIGLKIWEEPHEISPFLLTHHPYDEIIEGKYNLHGHIHPCVYLQGAGKQYLRLPCFHFGAFHGILPAFGAFTGMAKVDCTKADKVYVITKEKVIEV